MKLRLRSTAPTKVEIPTAAMIAVIFQFLILFTLNLKIFAPETNYNSNMPLRRPLAAVETGLTEIKVSIHSDRDGKLTQLMLGSKNLGGDEAAFDRLNTEILRIVGRPGYPLTRDVEVEIDADYETQYKYIVKAISNCTGRFDPRTKQVARYVEKIKFAPPHKPKA